MLAPWLIHVDGCTGFLAQLLVLIRNHRFDAGFDQSIKIVGLGLTIHASKVLFAALRCLRTNRDQFDLFEMLHPAGSKSALQK